MEKGKAKTLTVEKMEDIDAQLPNNTELEEPIVLRDEMDPEEIDAAAEGLIDWAEDFIDTDEAERLNVYEPEIPLFYYNIIENKDIGKMVRKAYVIHRDDKDDVETLGMVKNELASMLEGNEPAQEVLNYMIGLASPLPKENK